MKYIISTKGQAIKGTSNMIHVLSDKKEVMETEFYEELDKHIKEVCPIKQIDKALTTAKEYLKTGKSVSIEGKIFIIKKK